MYCVASGVSIPRSVACSSVRIACSGSSVMKAMFMPRTSQIMKKGRGCSVSCGLRTVVRAHVSQLFTDCMNCVEYDVTYYTCSAG